MALYKVIRDCFYKDRYWTEGEIADLPDKDPNEHFGPYSKEGNPTIVEVPPISTMFEMNQARRDESPKTGMAFPLEQQAQHEKRKRGPKPKAAV